jgi:hypothetical protein
VSTISSGEIDPEVLEIMRSRHSEGKKWAAYRNSDLSSPNAGHLTFLQVGEGCTYPTAPPKHPDTPSLIGWRYLLIGFVELESGDIVE